jgi:branched-chain amino acid transport system substrate-binding protein
VIARRFASLTAAALLAAVAAPAGAETGVTSNEILLGGTNAMTGAVAAVCYAVSHGSIAHFNKINEKGGIHGRKIRYNLLDDAYSAQRAVGNSRRLIQQDQVFAIFGGCGTATGAGVLSVVEQESEVPYIFPYAGLDKLVQPIKKNVFALMPLYASQISAIMPYVLAQAKPKTAAIFANNIAGNEELRDAAKDAFKKANVQLVVEELMEVTSPERAAFVLKAKDKNPDLVMLADTAPGGARFFIEMERQNWKPKAVTGISTLTDESFLRAAAPNAEGILMVPGVVLPPNAPQAKECVEELAAYNKDLTPSHFTMFGCLAARVLEEALRRAGPDLTRAKLFAAIESIKDYDTGLSGKVSFAADNHMGLDSVFPVGVEKGQFKILGEPIKITR